MGRTLSKRATLLKATYASDYRASRIDTFDPLRDLPNPLAVYDFSTLTGSNGSSVKKVSDLSALSHDLTSTEPPTKQVDSTDGLPLLRIGASQSMTNAQFGSGYPAGAPFAAPMTFVVLAKFSSSNTGTPMVVGGLGASAGGIKLLLRGTNNTGTPYINGGTNGTLLNGRSVFDDAWHIVVATVDSSAGAVYVDGHLTSLLTTTLGTDGLKPLFVGSFGAGSSQTLMDLRWLGVYQGRFSLAQVEAVTKYLAARAPGITTGKCNTGVAWEQTTDANSIACRIFTPTTPTSQKVLVLWSHPYTQNEQLSPAYWAYPLAHAAMAQGWYFAATNQHGDVWGADSTLTDLTALKTLVESRAGVTFDKVILAGASMGGLPSARALAAGTVANTAGAYFIDAVLDLIWANKQASFATSMNSAWAATSGTLSGATIAGATTIPTTASFASGQQLMVGAGTVNAEVVTASAASTGTSVAVSAMTNAHASGENVSNFPTKVLGKNPMAMSASTFAGTRMRFVASAADATANKPANTDAFRTLVGSVATESGLQTHGEGHLAACAIPSDFVDFVKRCIA